VLNNPLDDFGLEEAKQRWLNSDEELPIGPETFLRLCEAHKVAVPEKTSTTIRSLVESLYARGNRFGVTFLKDVDLPKRAPSFAGLQFALSEALIGIVPESSLRLRINMVPKALHGENLRKVLTQTQWLALRRRLIDERSAKCEYCGDVPANESDIEAHEEWEYDTRRRPARATVVGIKLACPKCHSTVHFGLQWCLVLAGKLPTSHLDRIEVHFCAVNECGKAMFSRHLDAAAEEWARLNQREKWRVDFGPVEALIAR
jgi:hypothetical protein